MSSDHRTITFNDIDIEIHDESDDDHDHHRHSHNHLPPVVAIEEDLEEEDNEGEDPELVKHAKDIEDRGEMRREFAPPSSLQLGHKAGQDHVVFKDGKDAVGGPKGGPQQRKQSTAQGGGGGSDIGMFDFDFDFDLDKAEDIVDYSVYENRTGLAEDMKFLASMPELCDITFLVGETREPVCAVKAVLASRSR